MTFARFWDAFQCDPFLIRHSDNVDAVVIEDGVRWKQPPPEFVLDLSETGGAAWSSPSFPLTLHASYRVRRGPVMLFGPNHLVGPDGLWTCETISRPGQHIAFYNSAAYQHIYKGAKPTVRPTTDEAVYSLSISEIDATDICAVDGEVFLATPLEPDNWGRWLSTVIPKVAYFRQHGLGRSMRLMCRCGKPWQTAVLTALGLDADQIMYHDPGRTYFCPVVHTIIYSAADLTPAAGERDIYAQLSRRYSVPRARRTRLYVSRLARSAAAPRYRVLTNEAALVQKLIDLGFDVINPELHSFEEQVSIFAGAEIVVGLGGAGMFNVVFCQPGTKVVTIESSKVFINDHSRLFAASGLLYGVIFGKQDLDDPAPVHKRWTIDTDRAIQAIKGFL